MYIVTVTIQYDYYINVLRALSSHHKIPEARVKELMQTLKTYYNVEDVTEDMIKEAARIDPRLVRY